MHFKLTHEENDRPKSPNETPPVKEPPPKDPTDKPDPTKQYV